jgi:flagellar biosynthesis protein FlhG
LDKFLGDQAEGLRRLLAHHGSRVIAVIGGSRRVGGTTAVVNLAAALAELGRDVIVVDEHTGPGSVSSMLGATRGAGNFAALIYGQLTLTEALSRHPLGFGVLTASPANRAGLPMEAFDCVFDGQADVVLIDAELDRHGALSPLALHAHDVVVVTRAAAQEITDTYAALKRLHYTHAIPRFWVLANQVHSATDAKVAFENLAGVASRYLAVALHDAGSVSADPRMARATELARCVVDAFPSTPAARDFRQLAAELQYWPMRPAMSSRGQWMPAATVPAASQASQPSAEHA